MSEDRIIELEIKVAYQEDLLQSLNIIVSQQQLQIKQLEATCHFLHDRIKNVSTPEGISQDTDRPPHY